MQRLFYTWKGGSSTTRLHAGGRIAIDKNVAVVDTCCSECNADRRMIRSFDDRATEAVFNGRCPKGFPADLFNAARRKLTALNAAATLEDLKAPPSNKLHPLDRDRAGQHAIAVNDQFRLCFVWTDAGPERVEFTDYH